MGHAHRTGVAYDYPRGSPRAAAREPFRVASMRDVEDVRREAPRRIETGRRAELSTWPRAQAPRFEGVQAEERFNAIRNLPLGP